MTRPAFALAAFALAAVLALAAGYAAAGASGFVVVLLVTVAIVLLVLRLRIPPPAPRARPPDQQPMVPDFADYEETVAALGMAVSSSWHFQRVTAPRLHRLLGDLLASRRRTGIGEDALAAREALGPDLWALLDPAQQAPAGRDARGPSLETLRRVVERLEDI